MNETMAYEDNIDAFKIGNEEAYKELIETYKKPLFNLVYSIISNTDEAEEIVQDVFVSFYIKRESFEGRSKIYTWLYRVSFNRAVDHIRKREKSIHKKVAPEAAVRHTIPAPGFRGSPRLPEASQHHSGRMGISFLMLCSSEISVSVEITPGISCILLFSNSIRCSLSRA